MLQKVKKRCEKYTLSVFLCVSVCVSVLESQKFYVTPIEAVKVRDEKENIDVSQFQISNEKSQKPPKITKDLMVFLLVILKLCLA